MPWNAFIYLDCSIVNYLKTLIFSDEEKRQLNVQASSQPWLQSTGEVARG